ncbi:MAG TPA: lantibiotic dehydratase C-terminal domain-containing protein [Ktedonobacteraceae bacterium]|nr:lantibiotic dehydratase C-terminal domain-containing protein [Ktedonobacteraceae bacterium]
MTAQWHSIHVYYYDNNKDDLLLDCIRPLFTSLQEQGWLERAYFTRHWRGGSHIRLQMYTDPVVFQQKVVPYVQERVGTYLQAHPSTAQLKEQDARQQHERRKLASSEELAYVELKPNNSLEVVEYEDMARTVGSASAASLLETYYVETNDLAFSLLEQTRNNYTARLNVCFDLLVALVATSPFLPIRRAYMSYRSHVEAYITCEPNIEEPRLRRARMENAYAQRHAIIIKKVQRLLSQIENTPERLPDWLRGAIDLYRRYGELAYQDATEGSLRLKTNEDFAAQKDSVRLEESAYRVAVVNNAAVLQASNTPLIVAHRIELNFLYLQLSRIGMLNEDRYILDYYIASAVEEIFAIDPVAAMSASKK